MWNSPTLKGGGSLKLGIVKQHLIGCSVLGPNNDITVMARVIVGKQGLHCFLNNGPEHAVPVQYTHRTVRQCIDLP
jgi:hypothetical protein